MSSGLPRELLHSALAAAVKAATTAGAILQQCYRERYDNDECFVLGNHKETEFNLDVDEKTAATDLVTKYDKECDATITRILSEFNVSSAASEFTFKFITEELAPDEPLTVDPTWIVDPIDGTMSFVHKSFDCCISIGLSFNKKPCLGVVYCPFLGTGELYTAVDGEGAFLNGKRIWVSGCTHFTKAVVLFNMPWRISAPATEASIGIRRELALDKVRAIRSYGAAVFNLAQVACGRADLYMECGGKMWDVCAGAVLVQEAGGAVRDLNGGPFELGAHIITVASSEAVADYGAALCRKYDLHRQYFSD